MLSIPKQIAEKLNENYTLNQEQIDFYVENKFIKLFIAFQVFICVFPYSSLVNVKHNSEMVLAKCKS